MASRHSHFFYLRDFLKYQFDAWEEGGGGVEFPFHEQLNFPSALYGNHPESASINILVPITILGVRKGIKFQKTLPHLNLLNEFTSSYGNIV